MLKASGNHFIWGMVLVETTFIMEERRWGLGWVGRGIWELSSVILRAVMWKREKNWSVLIHGQKLESLGRSYRETCLHPIQGNFHNCRDRRKLSWSVVSFLVTRVSGLWRCCYEDFSIGLVIALNELLGPL